jgi:hypothetical protein
MEMDGNAVDLNTKITGDCKVNFIHDKGQKTLEILRTARPMSMAEGDSAPTRIQAHDRPVWKNGFLLRYRYGTGFRRMISRRLKRKKENHRLENPFRRRLVSKPEAMEFYKGEPYKLE